MEIFIQFPVEETESIQTKAGVITASCSVGTGDSFLGHIAARVYGTADYLHPSGAKVKNVWRCTNMPHVSSWRAYDHITLRESYEQ